MTKTYDRRYFDRWYRQSRHGRDHRLSIERKARLALALAEYHLERPVRSVLDVGCGEGAWRAPLLKLRPGLRYRGFDASEYAVARFGRARNLGLASFGQMAELRIDAPVDLLVCSDVMHYLPTPELKRGLSGFAELCSGLAFLDVYCREDAITGDLDGFIARPARWYRQAFADAGFTACGSNGYLSAALRDRATALEIPG